ncbi:MAG TPA: class I SAM-dependent methyltransferase [Aggregatilineales bacterium]|nr:class I SAM-dependent methyltransferase [Aggregatilineales bacterium]
MTTLDHRSQNEILHGQMLADSGNPEKIWNWDSPAGKVRAVRRGKLLAQSADIKPGMQILEVGCGTGVFTELLSKYGAHILAVDLSPALLAVARARNLSPDQVEFREMRFEDGEADGPFDAIIGSSVLHHLELAVACERIFALLKPGGVIAFAEPNMLNPEVWLERHVRAYGVRKGVSPDETAIVRWKLADRLKKIGFTEIQIANVDWLHPASPKSLIPAIYSLGLWLEKIPLVREFSGSVLIRACRPA